MVTNGVSVVLLGCKSPNAVLCCLFITSERKSSADHGKVDSLLTKHLYIVVRFEFIR